MSSPVPTQCFEKPPFQKWQWNGMLYLAIFFLGCTAPLGLGWELYGSDRCSVLVLTGIYKFLLSTGIYLHAMHYKSISLNFV
jgi:hypothetical protein